MHSIETHAPPETAADWWSPGRFALMLFLLVLAAYPQVLLGWETFYYRDYGVLGYPFIHHHKASLWNGDWPLWNPLSNCGAPFLAQWGTMTLYPLSIIYLALPLPWSLGLFCLLHVWLAGLGMYLLVRRWTGDTFGAAVAGVGFAFSGATLAALMWPNYTVALAWMPWVLWSVERGWHQGARWLAAATLLATMQMLSGVPEIVLLTWLLLGAIALEEFFVARVPRTVLLRRLAIMVLLTTGLSAVQLLPFFELLAHSQRSQGFAPSKWAMPAWGWANLLVPLFHSYPTPQGPFIQGGQDFLASYYPGAALLVLALAALWQSRSARLWLLAAAAGLTFAMASGENGPLYPLIKRQLPVVGFARYPVKFVFALTFVLPVLAGCMVSGWKAGHGQVRSSRFIAAVLSLAAVALMVGLVFWAREHPYANPLWSAADQHEAARLQALHVPPNAAVRAILLIILVALLFIWTRMAAGKRQRLVEAAFVSLLFLDLYTAVPRRNPTIASNAFAPGAWQGHYHRAPLRLGEGRVFISPGAENQLLYWPETNGWRNLVQKRLALWSNLNLLEQAPKVNGSSTLQLRWQAQVQALIYSGSNHVSRGLLDFLGARLVSAPREPLEWWERTNACPLITCGQAPVFADQTTTLKAFTQDTFDPRAVVYLQPEDEATVTVTNRTEAEVVAGRFTAHRVEATVSARQTTLLVIAQSYYGPWTASIDGHETPLLRANHAFQAVEVPAGRHEVVVRYEDRTFHRGAILSLVTALLTGTLALVGTRGRRRPHSERIATV